MYDDYVAVGFLDPPGGRPGFGTVLYKCQGRWFVHETDPGGFITAFLPVDCDPDTTGFRRAGGGRVARRGQPAVLCYALRENELFGDWRTLRDTLVEHIHGIRHDPIAWYEVAVFLQDQDMAVRASLRVAQELRSRDAWLGLAWLPSMLELSEQTHAGILALWRSLGIDFRLSYSYLDRLSSVRPVKRKRPCSVTLTWPGQSAEPIDFQGDVILSDTARRIFLKRTRELNREEDASIATTPQEVTQFLESFSRPPRT